MEAPPSPIINLDNQTQGFDNFNDVTPTQPPTKNTLISSISKAKEVKKWGKHAKVEKEIMYWNVEHQLERIANALKGNKSQFISKQLFDEIMTLSDHYAEYDLGRAYDYLFQNLPLGNGFINKTHSLYCP